MYNVTPTEQVSQSFAHVDRHQPNHRRQQLGMHVFARSGYFSFSHTGDTLSEPTLYTCSVWIYIEHSITTVLLQYAILYKNGMNIVI